MNITIVFHAESPGAVHTRAYADGKYLGPLVFSHGQWNLLVDEAGREKKVEVYVGVAVEELSRMARR